MEKAPPVRVTTPEGLLKERREPVLALLEPVRAGRRVSCAWVFTHAGLVPGDYPMNDGSTVTIPQALCGDLARAHRSVTLEAA